MGNIFEKSYFGRLVSEIHFVLPFVLKHDFLIQLFYHEYCIGSDQF